MSTLKLTRRHDWPERLIAFIESRRFTSFAWGSNDCALFSADAVLEMTGADFAADLRGYKTQRGALSRIKKAGGMQAFASNLEQKKTGFAGRGDIVLVVLNGRDTFGVVSGSGHWCAPGAQGLLFRPMSEVTLAFGI